MHPSSSRAGITTERSLSGSASPGEGDFIPGSLPPSPD
jgi:hypothetical protein